MKKINIMLYINSYIQFEQQLQKIVSVFSNDDIFHLEINLIMDKISDNEVEKVVNYIKTYPAFKEVTNNTIYTFIATVLPTHNLSKVLTKIKGLLSRISLVYSDSLQEISDAVKDLQRKKLPATILIKNRDFNKIVDIYKRCSILGVPIFSDVEIEYNDEFTSLFWKWVYDKDGCRFNVFADILSSVLIDYWGTKCEYKSCLTKYFTIDSMGNIYGCSKTSDNIICNLEEVSILSEIFSRLDFISLLENAIKKRDNCQKICSFYDICQGGCLLTTFDTIEDCKDRSLFMIVESIKEQFKKIINDSDYRELNPAVKEMILSGIASNKLFEKGLVV